LLIKAFSKYTWRTMYTCIENYVLYQIYIHVICQLKMNHQFKGKRERKKEGDGSVGEGRRGERERWREREEGREGGKEGEIWRETRAMNLSYNSYSFLLCSKLSPNWTLTFSVYYFWAIDCPYC
jgi:hypothetical protein